MKIIKTISFIMIAACVIQAKADYQVMIKVPDANIIKMMNVVSHTPFIGEWIDTGEPNNCSAWTPLPTTVKKGQTFEQSSTCKQEQIRKIEDQVKDLNTGLISKTGKYTEESQITNSSKTQSSVGTRPIVKECVYGASDGKGYWLERPDNTVSFTWYGPYGNSPERVSKILTNNETSYTQDGYTYTKGDFNSYSSVSGSYYKICRE